MQVLKIIIMYYQQIPLLNFEGVYFIGKTYYLKMDIIY